MQDLKTHILEYQPLYGLLGTIIFIWVVASFYNNRYNKYPDGDPNERQWGNIDDFKEMLRNEIADVNQRRKSVRKTATLCTIVVLIIWIIAGGVLHVE